MHPIDLASTLDETLSLFLLLTYTLVCSMVSGFAIARALEARRRARDAQDAIDGAATLRDGGSVVTGLAETEGQVPVSVRLSENGRQWRTKKGTRHEWVEANREVRAEPFVVVTDNGERVRVEPQGRAILVDRMTVAKQEGDVRERVAELTDGEEVAVTGTLRREGAESGGAYRSGPPSWVIEPPTGGVMIVSTQPLADRHRYWARTFMQIAIAPVVVAIAVNALAYGSFTQFALWGRPATGHVQDLQLNTWHDSHGTHTSVDVDVDVEGDTVRTNVDEATYLELHRGDPVAVVVVPGATSFAHEAGLSRWLLIAAGMFALVTWVAVTFAVRRRRLWWEQKRVVTSGTGPL